MNLVLRRISVLSAGVAILALEAIGSGPAAAGGLTTQQACMSAGGTPQLDKKSKKYWCSTPAKDAECQRILDDYDDADGPGAFYNVRTRKCQEGCFLTTACVDHIGLADDCFELSVLRRFRDTVLARAAGGSEDIARYYRNAPAIVQRILASAAPERELARLYARYILPSALAAWLGLHRLARRTYSSMMRELSARYGIALA